MDPNENPLSSPSRIWNYAVRPGEIALLRAFQFSILDKHGDPSGHDLYQLKLHLIALRSGA